MRENTRIMCKREGDTHTQNENKTKPNVKLCKNIILDGVIYVTTLSNNQATKKNAKKINSRINIFGIR